VRVLKNSPYNYVFAKIAVLLTAVLFVQAGCKSPADHRIAADKAALEIIAEKQQQATGKKTDFTIERPSDTLRRRLMEGQDLPHAGKSSLGTDQLERIEHWPEEDYPFSKPSRKERIVPDSNETVELTLIDALRIGAENSFDYQNEKERVFRSALSLELERDEFRNTFLGQVRSLLKSDTTGNRTVSGMENSGEFGISRKLESGAELSSTLAVDLANLFTLGNGSSVGLTGDASISVPLLRGAGEHIVTEPLKQAERNVVYSLWEFERFKKSFAVDIASRYLSVLQQLDVVNNSEADYRRRIAAARRVRRLSEAGRIEPIQVDQAVQNELGARQGWIGAKQRYKSTLDSFKEFLDLPPDARIKLDPNELERLAAPAQGMIDQYSVQEEQRRQGRTPPADAPIELQEPNMADAGPYEMKESRALDLAFENRLDFKVSQGKVYDALRKVVVAADSLQAELSFLGSAGFGQGRSIGSAAQDNASFRLDEGVFSGLLSLDLPFERTQESINYRQSYINLEQAVRDVQKLEDSVKTDIRNALRNLLEARESIMIQAQAVYVARKRVESVSMFLQAGRAETRDLLEAQDSLLSAQNALSSAVVNYRITELAIQRDIGVLKIDEQGLWQEYEPGDNQDA